MRSSIEVELELKVIIEKQKLKEEGNASFEKGTTFILIEDAFI